jgi:hypothetical protein
MSGGTPDIRGLDGGPQKTIVLHEKGRPSSDAHTSGKNMKTSFGVTDILSIREYDKIAETFKTAYNLPDQLIGDYMKELYEERTIIDQYKKQDNVELALREGSGGTEAHGNPKYDKGPGRSIKVYIRKDSPISALLKDMEELTKSFVGNDPTNISGNDNNYMDDIIVQILSEPDRTLLTTIPMGRPKPETLPPAEDIADADTYYDEYEQGTDQDQDYALETDSAAIMTRGQDRSLLVATDDPEPAPEEPVEEPVVEYKVTKTRGSFLSDARHYLGYAGVVVYDPRAYMVALRNGTEVASSDDPKTDPILSSPVKARQELERQNIWNGGVYNLLLTRTGGSTHSNMVDFHFMNNLLKKATTSENDARVYTDAYIECCQLGNRKFGIPYLPANYRGPGTRPIEISDYNRIVIYQQMVDDANKVTCNDGTTFKSSQGGITEEMGAKYYCHANNQFASKYFAALKKFPNLANQST